jgi:hypothetical protein
MRGGLSSHFPFVLSRDRVTTAGGVSRAGIEAWALAPICPRFPFVLSEVEGHVPGAPLLPFALSEVEGYAPRAGASTSLRANGRTGWRAEPVLRYAPSIHRLRRLLGRYSARTEVGVTQRALGSLQRKLGSPNGRWDRSNGSWDHPTGVGIAPTEGGISPPGTPRRQSVRRCCPTDRSSGRPPLHGRRTRRHPHPADRPSSRPEW